MDRPPPRKPDASQDLGLAGFHQSDDRGLSLDQLSAAFADLLQRGHDPYTPIPEAPSPGAAPVTASIDPAPLPREAGARPIAVVAAETGELAPRGILEALLFVGSPTNEPLTSEQVARVMRGVRAAEVDELVVELNAEYEANRCPYTIISVGAGYRLVLAPEFERLRERYFNRSRQVRLSPNAIEVLAVVAYKGPISVEAIDGARGKPSASLLRQLVRRHLLAVERSTDPPRQTLYRTAQRFLDLFGLESVADLPKPQEIDKR